MNWYIVQAYSGFEKKVVEVIKDELKKHKLSEKLEEILVPTHQVTEVKKGKKILSRICFSKNRTYKRNLSYDKKFTKSKWVFRIS